MAKSPERAPQSPEAKVEQSTENRYERYERPETAAEIATLESAEQREKKARSEALETAISVERGGAERAARPADNLKATVKKATGKKAREANFKRQMERVQTNMKPSERAFSKFIHNKAVEKTSDFLGATVARPNAILSGAIVAFLAVLAVYIIAKNLGYVLSGFETIGAFIAGWVIGIVYDYLRLIITGKK